MQLRTSQKEQTEVNLTPLIDVVFLLLIFFMISTTFEQSASLQVSLPQAAEGETEQQSNPVVLAIDALGNMALDERRLDGNDPATVRAALSASLPAIQATTLVIHADAEVAHKHVVTVMDSAGELGITNLSIATIDQDDAP